jgi:hypothetical protein
MNLQFPWMWGISWLAEWYAETYEMAFQRLLGWQLQLRLRNTQYAMSIRGNTVLPSVGGLRELSHWNRKILLEQNYGIETAVIGNPSYPAILCDFFLSYVHFVARTYFVVLSIFGFACVWQIVLLIYRTYCGLIAWLLAGKWGWRIDVRWNAYD